MKNLKFSYFAFNGERADDRKEWLETPAANFEDFIVEAV